MLKHILRFENGYDCINFECIKGSKECRPGNGGSHGKSGLTIRFVSKGDKGAVQFVIMTGWMPQYANTTFGFKAVDCWGGPNSLYPFPCDLGYHSKTPHFDGQTSVSESCEYCDGQPCYYDGSSLNATNAMYTLVNGGDEELWKYLDKYYSYIFEGGEFPHEYEYKMAARGQIKGGE